MPQQTLGFIASTATDGLGWTYAPENSNPTFRIWTTTAARRDPALAR